MTNKKPTEDYIKEVEQDDRIIQFDAGEVVKDYDKFIAEHEKLHERAKGNYNVVEDMHINAKTLQSIGLPDLDEESKRSDRFFGMRLNKSTDDIENTFLVMFAEFVSLMAILIGTLGFGVLLWAIFS